MMIVFFYVPDATAALWAATALTSWTAPGNLTNSVATNPRLANIQILPCFNSIVIQILIEITLSILMVG
jgi:hypothetical protein